MSVSKRWCYTINNYEPDEALLFLGIPSAYHIMGKEISSTGTKHLQGYIIFETSKRLSGVKKLHPTAHWEIAIGTTEQNVKYCSKDGDFVERGTKPISSAEKGLMEKERWRLILQHAKDGTLEEHDPKTYFLHYQTSERLAARYSKPKIIEKTINVFWGETGTGKSHDAWELAGSDAYSKSPRSIYWCGYSGQTTMVIDEFRGGIDIAHILRWFDKYPLIVEIKGSSLPCKVDTIYVTSNLHPRDWYPDLDEETKNALLRRIKVTRYWGVLGKDRTKITE